MENHYSAWISITTDVLDNDHCALDVIRDEIVGIVDAPDGGEIPQWGSDGSDPVVQHTLTVDHNDDNAADKAIAETETVLEELGWTLISGWNAVDTGYVATVAKN